MEKYEFLQRVGEGAYGSVWKCRDKQTGALVAVKKLKEAPASEEESEIAMREVRLLQMARQQNIVHLLEAYRSQSGRLYLVFEYVERTLLQELKSTNKQGLSSALVKSISWQLLQSLSYLHRKKIIHRDIKPSNVLLTDSYLVKLCDFGFARPFSNTTQDFTTYVVTRWYRAPEVLVGDIYGPPVDIWALGCIVAEMLGGRPLFPGKNHHDQLWLILKCLGTMTGRQLQLLEADPQFACFRLPTHSEVDPLESRLPHCSVQTMQFLRACLNPDPAQRLTADELLAMPYFHDVLNVLPMDVLVAMEQQQQSHHHPQQGMDLQSRSSSRLKERLSPPSSSRPGAMRDQSYAQHAKPPTPTPAPPAPPPPPLPSKAASASKLMDPQGHGHGGPAPEQRPMLQRHITAPPAAMAHSISRMPAPMLPPSYHPPHLPPPHNGNGVCLAPLDVQPPRSRPLSSNSSEETPPSDSRSAAGAAAGAQLEPLRAVPRRSGDGTAASSGGEATSQQQQQLRPTPVNIGMQLPYQHNPFAAAGAGPRSKSPAPLTATSALNRSPASAVGVAGTGAAQQQFHEALAPTLSTGPGISRPHRSTWNGTTPPGGSGALNGSGRNVYGTPQLAPAHYQQSQQQQSQQQYQQQQQYRDYQQQQQQYPQQATAAYGNGNGNGAQPGSHSSSGTDPSAAAATTNGHHHRKSLSSSGTEPPLAVYGASAPRMQSGVAALGVVQGRGLAPQPGPPPNGFGPAHSHTGGGVATASGTGRMAAVSPLPPGVSMPPRGYYAAAPPPARDRDRAASFDGSGVYGMTPEALQLQAQMQHAPTRAPVLPGSFHAAPGGGAQLESEGSDPALGGGAGDNSAYYYNDGRRASDTVLYAAQALEKAKSRIDKAQSMINASQQQRPPNGSSVSHRMPSFNRTSAPPQEPPMSPERASLPPLLYTPRKASMGDGLAQQHQHAAAQPASNGKSTSSNGGGMPPASAASSSRSGSAPPVPPASAASNSYLARHHQREAAASSASSSSVYTAKAAALLAAAAAAAQGQGFASAAAAPNGDSAMDGDAQTHVSLPQVADGYGYGYSGAPVPSGGTPNGKPNGTGGRTTPSGRRPTKASLRAMPGPAPGPSPEQQLGGQQLQLQLQLSKREEVVKAATVLEAVPEAGVLR